MIEKFLNLLEILEQQLLDDMRKEIAARNIKVDSVLTDKDVTRTYAEYQAKFIEIRTIRGFFQNLCGKELFTDFIQLSEFLDSMPLNQRERACIILEAYKKNFRSGILEIENFEDFFIIDANKIVTVDFKTISAKKVFDLYKNGKILEFIDQETDDVLINAQIDELISRRNEYCMDGLKIYDNNTRLYDILITKDGVQTDDEIELVCSIMLGDRVSESVVNDVRTYLVNKRNKVSARKERQRKLEEETKVVRKEVVPKTSNLVTDKEYKKLKKEIKEYYDLYHVELLKSIDYETMIILASKMIRIGINKDEVKRFISKVKDELEVSDNSIVRFVSEFDRLNYYYEEEDLACILDYLQEIFICDDEEYEFWKEEVRKELNMLLNPIDKKYDYEFDVAKKRLSI